MNNSYPEMPLLPYQRTTVDMGVVIATIKSMFVSREVKIAMYVMFRNESGNGKSGINNNYTGVQADSGRWPAALDKYVTGTVEKVENKTKKVRRFCAFYSVEGNLAFLADRVQKRGLFEGATCTKIVSLYIERAETWCVAYYRSWVTGDAHAQISAADLTGLLSMYRQGENIFKNH